MKITAIVGSYRKGHIIDSAVDEILASAAAEGAQVAKIYLTDTHIEFCTNCRVCTQNPDGMRGSCPLADEMSGILDQLETSDGIILASPMNFWTVTAITKRFIERLVCYAYWPWGNAGPKMRKLPKTKRAVVVASSAAPAVVARLCTKLVKTLKQVANLMGAKTVGVLFIGLSARQKDQELGKGARRKAALLGKKLAAPTS
ncbi:flavodoxin family protein [Geomonas sp. RF6]|uniref:flavodoxin family protein n=1 Tax=Geomonas sp. RF6 TaxID=2897342 RepID=UPI001E46F508|nr:flavodoxin family protein [Geomonas sp. RF6]UFS68700.1 flavodoxin family protein [Geomonas sp. RF6]